MNAFKKKGESFIRDLQKRSQVFLNEGWKLQVMQAGAILNPAFLHAGAYSTLKR